ncbi:hypothetical protein [Varibaculum massiliense]|uniref:hypothetical protein n=1 Tax=Varibaculum massiliense TaxID=1852372 RepID=UPI00288A1763|nr:hypothetical protein [Varibaculum massiliense]
MAKTKLIVGAGVAAALLVTSSALAFGGVFNNGEDALGVSGKTPSAAGKIMPRPQGPKFKLDETTQVLVDGEVASDEIVKVIKHGDHWHVFTKDGREIITYTDPSKAKSAGQLRSTAKVLSAGQLGQVASQGVVKILKHGDHYHIYTADGQEFVTYTNPSGLYPGIAIGTYTGSHGGGKNPVPSYRPWRPQVVPAGGKTNPSGVPGSTVKPRPSGKPIPGGGLPLVRVVSLPQLAKLPIVKILQHADHYHAYTQAGEEYITYENPAKVFPQIKIGQYSGSHGGNGEAPKPNGGDKPNQPGQAQPPTEQRPKPGSQPGQQKPDDSERVVKIQRHGDHWHLHFADGHEGISYTDPSELYPDIEITEYEEEKPQDSTEVQEDEKFTYDQVEAKLIVPLEYITYGNVTHTTRFDQENQRFVIPHYDHYHYMTLDTIIQFARGGKDNMFHGYSARQVVATLKYLVLHPEARPRGENGWGSAAEVAP